MINKRIKILKLVVIILFFIIIIKMISLVLFNSNKYQELLRLKNEKIILGEESPRGRIYDCNMNILVDNTLTKVIYYQNISNSSIIEELKLAYTLADNLEVDYSNVTELMLKDLWIITHDSNILLTSNELEQYHNRKINNRDIYNIKIERITKEDIDIYNNRDKEAYYIYYLMHNGYSYQEKIIKNKDINDIEFAYIAENINELSGVNIKYSWERSYPYGDVFRTILGKVGNIPLEDKSYYLSKGYSLNDKVGISYIEKQYEDLLRGEKPEYKMLNSNNVVLSKEGKIGKDLVLSINIDLQNKIESILEDEVVKIKSEPSTEYYNHSYAMIVEANSGFVLGMSSKQVINVGNRYEVVDYSHNITTSAMTPGSVVKGASLLVGFNTQSIEIGEYLYDECIKIYNKPFKCSWGKLGRINDVDALVWSSNVYQFKTAMKVSGYEYKYNGVFNVKEEAINTYRKTFNEFGLGVKTGIDLPVEGIGNIGTSNSSDLYLNYAIGIYDTYTPLQLVQYINTIASDGKRYQLRLLKAVYEGGKLIYEVEPNILNIVETEEKYLKRVQFALEEGAKRGIAKGHMDKYQSFAGKTGTSESFLDTNNDGVVDTLTNSSAFVGYAPASNPIMSMMVISPNLVNPKSGVDARSFANSRISKRVSEAFFQIYT